MPLLANDRDYETVDVRIGYDRWSTLYDKMENGLLALEEPVVDELLGPVEGMHVVDVGCGTGRHALRIAARGAHVTGLDFSDGMLDKARAKPGAERVRFVQHDLSDPLPLADHSADRVVCCLVLEHIASLERVFREMRRICRRDGWAVISCMHPAMMLRGVLAHFSDPKTGREVQPRSRAWEIADFVMAALGTGWRLSHLSEHPVTEDLVARCPSTAKYLNWPLLLVMRLAPEAEVCQ